MENHYDVLRNLKKVYQWRVANETRIVLKTSSGVVERQRTLPHFVPTYAYYKIDPTDLLVRHVQLSSHDTREKSQLNLPSIINLLCLRVRPFGSLSVVLIDRYSYWYDNSPSELCSIHSQVFTDNVHVCYQQFCSHYWMRRLHKQMFSISHKDATSLFVVPFIDSGVENIV